MSFKCPANYVGGKSDKVYKRLSKSYSNIDDLNADGKSAINNYINNIGSESNEKISYFFENGVFPPNFTSDMTNYNEDQLKFILKGLTRKITSCSTAYKSSESYRIVSWVKQYMESNTFVNFFYIMSYIIIAYLGYNYITNKMFGSGDKTIPYTFGSYKIMYYIFIIFIPLTMISLMITNKAVVAFNASTVLLYFSFALVVFIGFIKTVASRNVLSFLGLIGITVVCSGFAGWGMYYNSGKSVRKVLNKDNQESERTDSVATSALPIILLSVLMIASIRFNNSKNMNIFIVLVLIVICFASVFGPKKFRNKRSYFYFIAILLPFFITTFYKWYVYNTAGIGNTAMTTAIYVGLKVSIFTGLIALGIYEAFRVEAEIKRTKKIETSMSNSPYYQVIKPINGLIYIYYFILALIIFIIFIVLISHSTLLFDLQSIRNAARVARAAPNFSQLENTLGYKGVQFSYYAAIIILMSLILSYNGTFAVWLPFILIPLGLFERGISTTILNIRNKNIDKEVNDWQPVGSYLVEFLVKLLTYTPLSDAQIQASDENLAQKSFLSVIGELNSTMFNAK